MDFAVVVVVDWIMMTLFKWNFNRFSDVVYCPNLLPFEITYRMLFILCTQYWKPVPNYEYLTVQDGIPEEYIERKQRKIFVWHL